MQLKRLQLIKEQVIHYDYVYDVGCDHGLLGLLLCQENTNIKVIAIDNKEKSLAKAEELVKKQKLDRMETCLNDGLENISIKPRSAVVIAGMGSKMILHILKQEKEKKAELFFLQSNGNLPHLRKQLHKLGMKIINETTLLEKGHWYVFLSVQYGKQRTCKKDDLYGPILRKNKEKHQDYFLYILKGMEDKLAKIPKKKWWERFSLKQEIKKLKKELVN